MYTTCDIIDTEEEPPHIVNDREININATSCGKRDPCPATARTLHCNGEGNMLGRSTFGDLAFGTCLLVCRAKPDKLIGSLSATSRERDSIDRK